MKFLLRLAMIVGLAFATPALSHPGHDDDVEPIARAAAEAEAQRAVQTMVRRKMLDASWAARPPVDAELRHAGEGHQWRVIFTNPAAKDMAKRSLFVFLRADGKYLTFNHTGK